MNWPTFVLGVLVGGLGGVALGVAAVAIDQKRLWQTLIGRASPSQLRHIRHLIRDRASALGYETSGELLRAAPPNER